jgi:hypothetical protein
VYRPGHETQQLATVGIAREAERSLRRSCAGRIVIMLTPIAIVVCGALYGTAAYGLYQTTLAQELAGGLAPILVMAFVIGLVLVVVLAGMIGNRLRRRLWRGLYRRAMRPRSILGRRK